MKPIKLSAVRALAPNSKFAIDADEVMINYKLKNGDSLPTEEEIQTKLTELQAEYDAQEYARNRASAYDSVGNQLDMLMKDMRDGTTTHQTACEAVKAKYPKP